MPFKSAKMQLYLRSALLMSVAALGFIFGPPLITHVIAQDVRVLDEKQFPSPDLMIADWLKKQTDQSFEAWQTRYDALQTPQQIAEYQKRLRDKFTEQIGGFPERTPLNTQITGVVQRKGYRVEKVMFDSQPGHPVTGLCFIPDSSEFKAPYPAVLIVCGHANDGKAQTGYQTAAALTALNGMIGFIIDPICQGERYQSLDEKGNILVKSPTAGHNHVGMGSILLGWNTARYEIWDGIRAIDYLQTRDDVVQDKIGCMGNSGGGTQTAYIMALDDRVQAASPSCYLTTYKQLLATIGPQDAEQIIHGQLSWGMDHSDFMLMRAPVPTMICTATKDMFPIAGSWESFRDAKRIYTRLGHSDRINLTEADAPHGWHPLLREAAVSWMALWLDGRNITVREPQVEVLSKDEVQVSPQGQVQLIAGTKSVHDLNGDEFKRLQPQRDALWSNAADGVEQVRKLAGIRTLNELSKPKATKAGELKEGDITIEKWVFETADNLVLPALLYRPQQAQKGPLLFVHEQGKQGTSSSKNSSTHSAISLAKSGHTVLAVDLRGTGETTPKKAGWYQGEFGSDGRYIATAYLLGNNFVGMRAEDLLTSARWLLEHEKLPADQQKLSVVSVGNVGIPTLHAAATEAAMFGNVSIVESLTSWEPVISSPVTKNQFVNVVHGALRAYDLTDLIKTLGERVQIVNPVDVNGKPIQ